MHIKDFREKKEMSFLVQSASDDPQNVPMLFLPFVFFLTFPIVSG